MSTDETPRPGFDVQRGGVGKTSVTVTSGLLASACDDSGRHLGPPAPHLTAGELLRDLLPPDPGYTFEVIAPPPSITFLDMEGGNGR